MTRFSCEEADIPDAGRGGIGATLTPDVGDGILSPGESTAVKSVIRLRGRDP